MNTILVIGGCRSGKSGHALQLADGIGNARKIFLATCIPQDDEMHQRVTRHQAERGAGWTAVETPLFLSEAIRDIGPNADVLLVDCLTLWVSNLMMEHADDPDASKELLAAQTRLLIESLRAAACPVILVTNEVGAGIVPDNPLARRYRDAVGLVNQRIAACVDQVIWMVAGIPVKIKPVNGQI
ncbi:MAG: bifunctional adenosylcobinamide kinase/adenosylcobinamide-phosphate guanylyltransferase [Deltaproteobacteria bacterium]|nr:bifunctional adenosylcobinamide kinase/adenosylcobinamide-phosphate guanylyltransferase [Deltaproteobacteria bacterium]